MANKGRDATGRYSPLIFIAHVFEIVAVVLFLVMALEMSGQSSEEKLAALEFVGILVLFAWLIRRIDKVVQIAGDALDSLLNRLWRSLTNVAPTGSSSYEPMELKDLCSWHRNVFLAATGASIVVVVVALVILCMFSLAEGSPVTSIVWDWTNRITIAILGMCLVWMSATLAHARRRCASESARSRA